MRFNNRPIDKALLGVVLAGAMVLSGGLGANAVEPESDAIKVLKNLGLMTSPASLQADQVAAEGPIGGSGPAGQLAPDLGLTVESGGSSVQMSPVSQAPGRIVAGGVALEYVDANSHSFVMTGEGSAANAGYVVINDASAPTEFRFRIDSNGAPASLESLADGSVRVRDSSGELVNVILPAWAKDANGVSVPTSYTVDGNILTQTVRHAGATYPVVADPGLACDLLFCTWMLDSEQTHQVATQMAVASAALSAACGALAAACAVGLAWAVDTANQAESQGQCLGIRKMHTAIVAFPVIQSC